MKPSEIKQQAEAFIKRWENRGDEKQDTQSFWIDLLTNVFEVGNIASAIEFEKRVKLAHTSFIDAYIPDTKVLIEQKSSNIDLYKAAKQSDGVECTPFEQAKRYANELPASEKPSFIVVCNFNKFLIYNLEIPGEEPQEVLLKNLDTEFARLSFLNNLNAIHINKQFDVSIEAGNLVAKIYDAIHNQYIDPESDQSLRSLNILCVRLVFCLYAEDSDLFLPNQFSDYISTKSSQDIRKALIDLFEVLNTKENERDPYLSTELARFPYVNGGLFAEDNIEIPNFTDDIKSILVDKAGNSFNWSKISPTIFGAIFETTLNPETREEGGMHYTSIENIHKVIDPLFLNDLEDEFNSILKRIQIQDLKRDKAQYSKGLYLKEKDLLHEFQNKLASLSFLDPACGSGNFLTETYLSLRKLENKVLAILSNGSGDLFIEETVKVNISQFYGIEINDFAVSVAKTAMWIAEAQMLEESNALLRKNIDFLPLKSYLNIHEENALTINWEDIVSSQKLSFIIGNPPFKGAMTAKEKRPDLKAVFPECKEIGQIDYVSGWFVKAAKYIKDTNIRCGLVATNSLCQGQSVDLVWGPLINKFDIKIDFAHTTFKWYSGVKNSANVHCVIVGFSNTKVITKKYIFSKTTKQEVFHINPYLNNIEDCFVSKRSIPLCNVEKMLFGSMPRDGHSLIIKENEYDDFVGANNELKSLVKPYIGADEFIKGKKRYCLWLKDIDPSIINRFPKVLERINLCKNMRLKSSAAATRKLAKTPYLFAQIAQPDTDYIFIPATSSENRRYIPIGFLSKDIIASNSAFIIPKATMFDFGVLTSSVHMAWMRLVAGRLESRYRYSKEIVYNNYIWPEKTVDNIKTIEKTAKLILEARDKYPTSSYSDLYNELTMPQELVKAHEANDRAVLKAYGFDINLSEDEIVKKLLSLYVQKIKLQDSAN